MKIIFKIALFIFSFASFSAYSAVIVDARLNSSSGGVGAYTSYFFNAGDHFSASVALDDLWNAGSLPRWSNADGLTGNLYANGTDDSGYAFNTLIGQNFGTHSQHGLAAAYGSLVGSIDGNFFLMGANYAGTAIATGQLRLWYWDSNNVDNSEQISVTITPTALVTEPKSIALFVFGLIILIMTRRIGSNL